MLRLGENVLLARSTCLTANFFCQLPFCRAPAQGLFICVRLRFGVWLELGCAPACGNSVNSPKLAVVGISVLVFKDLKFWNVG